MDTSASLWLKFAERDLRGAKKNYEIEEYHVSAFLAQQSAEKALKAIHIKETGSFPKTHDLTRLAKLINAPEDIVELCAEIIQLLQLRDILTLQRNLTKKRWMI
jgi:HEPN domain-containing protein